MYVHMEEQALSRRLRGSRYSQIDEPFDGHRQFSSHSKNEPQLIVIVETWNGNDNLIPATPDVFPDLGQMCVGQLCMILSGGPQAPLVERLAAQLVPKPVGSSLRVKVRFPFSLSAYEQLVVFLKGTSRALYLSVVNPNQFSSV
jgi:hypothetical protein